jgi:erythromycin esterase-like protein
MWRNADGLDFVGWLRRHNDTVPPGGGGDAKKVGFYGLDLYSLHGSMQAVLEYLGRVDPAGAERARERYACFDNLADEPQRYGFNASLGMGRPCEAEVLQQLVEMQEKAGEYFRCHNCMAEDEFFYAEQNARLVRDAEQYYRSMYEDEDESSWNLRDTHMADTLDHLAAHLSRRAGRPAKIVVWAHNSHLGDARATDVAKRGELNLGQLVRQRHDGDTAIVGFSTYTGTVTAADGWGGVAKQKAVRPGMDGSYELLFHETGLDRFLLNLREGAMPEATRQALRSDRLQRAIGVIYLPKTERYSHYYHTRLADQFDAMIHIDQTRAVEPLEEQSAPQPDEASETYPSGV